MSRMHGTICNACLKFNLPNEEVKGIISYLCNRTQRVKVNNTYSSTIQVSSGVPQGSIVGPLRLELFANILLF